MANELRYRSHLGEVHQALLEPLLHLHSSSFKLVNSLIISIFLSLAALSSLFYFIIIIFLFLLSLSLLYLCVCNNGYFNDGNITFFPDESMNKVMKKGMRMQK